MVFGFKIWNGDEDSFFNLILFPAYHIPGFILIVDDSLGIPPPKENLKLGE